MCLNQYLFAAKHALILQRHIVIGCHFQIKRARQVRRSDTLNLSVVEDQVIPGLVDEVVGKPDVLVAHSASSVDD